MADVRKDQRRQRGRELLVLAVAVTSAIMLAIAAQQWAHAAPGGGSAPTDPREPVWICWDYDDPPAQDYVELVEEILYLETFHLANRWPGEPGDPIALTWSLIPDGIMIPESGHDEPPQGSLPSELFATMDDQFGSREAWVGRVEEAFDRWGALTGIDFTRVTLGDDDWDDGAEFGTPGDGVNRGDIRIGGRCIDGTAGSDCAGGDSMSGNILAWNQLPDFGGDMVLDTSDNFDIGGTELRLRNLVMHELGHGIGMRHVCPIDHTKLMEPLLTLLFDGPQHDDIRGGHVHYGDPFEIDDDAASATDLGVLDGGAPIDLGAGDFPDPAVDLGSLHSLDADGEQDIYRFEVTSLGLLNVTLTPIGHVYDSSTQAGGGGCNSGNFIDSEAVADLAFEIIDGEGSTVLLTVDSEPAGGVETAIDFPLLAVGPYYVRVYESDASEESQLYGLSLGIQMEPPVAICQPFDAFSDTDCCVTVTVEDIDGGSFDPNGAGDIDTVCITAVDGEAVGCESSVVVCDDGTLLPHTVTLTITDLSGASASCDTTVTVLDATGPELACPPEVGLTCPASTDPVDTGTATAVDNCDLDPVVAWSDVEIPSSCPADPVMLTIERTWTALDVSGNENSCLQVITVRKVEAALDIKPGSCPNVYPSFDRYLSVGLLGTGDFDVTQVDLSTVQVSRGDCVGGEVTPHDGPPGPSPVIDDVVTPLAGALCDCHLDHGDGIPDLSMGFKTADVVSVLELSSIPSGTEIELVVTGELVDGCPFVARDCITVIPPGPSIFNVLPSPPGVAR